MSKDNAKTLRRAGQALAAAAAVFFIAVLAGAALMLGGSIATDFAKAVLISAIALALVAALTVWRLTGVKHTKRRK